MPCYGLAEHVLYAAGKRDMSRAPHRICVDAAQLNRYRKLVTIDTHDESSPSTTTTNNSNIRWLISSGEHLRCDVVSDSGRLLIVDPVTHVCVPSISQSNHVHGILSFLFHVFG
jgi:hypothetical protein